MMLKQEKIILGSKKSQITRTSMMQVSFLSELSFKRDKTEM